MYMSIPKRSPNTLHCTTDKDCKDPKNLFLLNLKVDLGEEIFPLKQASPGAAYLPSSAGRTAAGISPCLLADKTCIYICKQIFLFAHVVKTISTVRFHALTRQLWYPQQVIQPVHQLCCCQHQAPGGWSGLFVLAFCLPDTTATLGSRFPQEMKEQDTFSPNGS